MLVPSTTPPLSDRPIHALFDPASVAVVGASEDTRKWGNWLAQGALRGESHRPAFLINHRAGETVLGRRAYRSLDELPEAPDLVVIAVPAAAVDSTVTSALAAGARAIVIISAGPREADAALAERVRAAGAVLLGPNCLGVLDSGRRLELVPNPLPAGAIGLISQSGNLALELGLLAVPEGLGFSRFASLGNQADLGATDLVTEFAAHDATELIAVYVEDFRDGRAFARAAAAAVRAGKPVVALAIDRAGAGARAVQSHTGALASDAAAIDAAFTAAGVQRVHTPRELVDAAQALLRCPAARGRRVAVLGDGGGHGSIAAAVAARAGLEVPELSEAVAQPLRAALPAAAGVSNPIDLAGGAEQDVHAFDRIALQLLSCGEVDSLFITGYFGGYAEYSPETAAEELRTAELIGAAAQRTGRPIVTHTMYPRGTAAQALRGAGVPVYESVEQAAAALALLAARGAWRAGVIPELPGPDAPVGGGRLPGGAGPARRGRDPLRRPPRGQRRRGGGRRRAADRVSRRAQGARRRDPQVRRGRRGAEHLKRGRAARRLRPRRGRARARALHDRADGPAQRWHRAAHRRALGPALRAGGAGRERRPVRGDPA